MLYAGSGDPELTIRLLWDREPTPTRGPTAATSKSEIVAAAIDIADMEGLLGLSMRKLAQRVGLTPMSLYPRIGGKSELLDLMLDRAIAELIVDAQARTGPWRAGMEHGAWQAWRMYRRHPWLLDIAAGRSPLGPSEFAYFEQQLGLFDGVGVPDETAMQSIGAVGNYVRGSARASLELRRAAHETGVTDAAHWRARTSTLRDVVDEATRQRFPRLISAGVLDSFLGDMPPATVRHDHEVVEPGFEFGLARLLDGIEFVIQTAAASTTP